MKYNPNFDTENIPCNLQFVKVSMIHIALSLYLRQGNKNHLQICNQTISFLLSSFSVHIELYARLFSLRVLHTHRSYEYTESSEVITILMRNEDTCTNEALGQQTATLLKPKGWA
jgi:hypothetical protein